MFENLEIFQMAHGMAKHAGARQTVIAQNVANADTPDYVAKDIEPFRSFYETSGQPVHQRATRVSHLNGVMDQQLYPMNERQTGPSDPNGNSVSIESEMLHAVDTKRQHDRATMIYKSALTILRTAVQR